ncbi:MAG: sortase [Caldilineaceae bacterium]|nr:sortase [Caldilineaceae bacterium]
MKRVFVVLWLVAGLVIAGCGSTASAGENTAAATTAPAPAARQDPARRALAQQEGAGRPVAPIKAPVFHQPDAKRILPSRIVIPNIKLDTGVVELGWSTKKDASGSIFSEWDVAEYAAGWHKNSAVPGESGNVVLSGHNNIKGAVFRELDQLKRGDPIYLYAGGREYDYEVDQVLILPEKYASEEQRRDNVNYIKPTGDDRLTLVSCWPRNDNTHRIVVIARPLLVASTR